MFALCAVAVLSWAGSWTTPALAQGDSKPRAHDRVELTRAVVDLHRKEAVANALELTALEAGRFWPMYRRYHTERSLLVDRRAALILAYVEDPLNVSIGEAEEMLDESLAIRAAELELKKRYVPEFKKVIPTLKVVRYFQVENKLDAAVQLELAKAIPLVW